MVGSGLSGYSAAARLIENGITDIVVLEAENRIGGRIHSVPYRQGLIDMGENSLISFDELKIDEANFKK